MTTIVSNLECMAADQRATGDGPLCHVTKIHPIGDSIFGLAGDIMSGMAVIDWLRTEKRKRAQLYKMFGTDMAWRYEFVLLELSPTGLALWNAWGVRLPILDRTYGIGTGAAAALEAMDSGHSPEEAVRRATKRDECSGLLTEPEVVWLLPSELRGEARRK